jgi:hypothetical protein
MPCVGFEATITASELAKTVHALDRSATVTGIEYLQVVTTNNYKTLSHLHNLQSLHTNFLNVTALVLTDL